MTFEEVTEFLRIGATTGGVTPEGILTLFMSAEERRYIWDCVSAHAGLPAIEIGSAYGGPTILMACAGAVPVWSIDNWSCGKRQECEANIACAGLTEQVRMLVGDSGAYASHFEDSSLGVVLVDGCHSGEKPYEDIVGYAPKVKVGGFLLVDDTGNKHWDVERALDRWAATGWGVVEDRVCRSNEGDVKLRGFVRR